MAGKKNAAALSPEERIKQALVPADEQPYALPENWCWVKMGLLGYTNIGLTYKPSDVSKTGTIVLRSSNIQDGKICYDDLVRVNMEIPQSKMSQSGDILICARNGSKALVGKTAIIDKDGMSYGAFMAIFRSQFNPLIYYYLNSPFFRDIIDRDVGTTTINQVTQQIIKDLPFPLPPLAEQQRIVDRIEELFTDLDKAKEKAQAILDSADSRKSAILNQAFNGELTEQWRNENGVNFDSWQTLTVSDIGEVITGSTPDTKKPNFYGGKIPFIKPTELNQGRNVITATDTLTEAGKAVSRPVRAGSTCVCCIGATISKCGFLTVDAVTNQQINSIIPYSFMCDEFVYYYCISSQFKFSLISNSSATTLPIINKKKMSALKFIVPPKKEQAEIVRILDDMLTKEQRISEAAEEMLEKIELIKKAVLADAFRGRLGTNDPADEPATELLKQILT